MKMAVAAAVSPPSVAVRVRVYEAPATREAASIRATAELETTPTPVARTETSLPALPRERTQDTCGGPSTRMVTPSLRPWRILLPDSGARICATGPDTASARNGWLTEGRASRAASPSVAITDGDAIEVRLTRIVMTCPSAPYTTGVA